MIKSQYAPFTPVKSPGKLVRGRLHGLPEMLHAGLDTDSFLLLNSPHLSIVTV